MLLASCAPEALTLEMVAQNQSGQDGTATLTQHADGLEVRVEIKKSSIEGLQNAHIHQGRCDDVRGILYGISDRKTNDGGAGASDTSLFLQQRITNTTLAALRDGNHVINVHDARDNSLYVSCGEIN